MSEPPKGAAAPDPGTLPPLPESGSKAQRVPVHLRQSPTPRTTGTGRRRSLWLGPGILFAVVVAAFVLVALLTSGDTPRREPAGPATVDELVERARSVADATASTSERGQVENPVAFDVPVQIAVGQGGQDIWEVQVSSPRIVERRGGSDPDVSPGPAVQVEIVVSSIAAGGTEAGLWGVHDQHGFFTDSDDVSLRHDRMSGCVPFGENFGMPGPNTASRRGFACIRLLDDQRLEDFRYGFEFIGGTLVFAPDGTQLDEPIDWLGRISRSREYDVDWPVPLDLSVDDQDAVWNVRASAPRSIPGGGAGLVGVDVDMVLVSSSSSPTPAAGRWEVVGGATGMVYQPLWSPTAADCFINPLEQDATSAYIGGSLRGTTCFDLQRQDVGHPNTSAVLNHGGDRIVFVDGAARVEVPLVQRQQLLQEVEPSFVTGSAIALTIERRPALNGTWLVRDWTAYHRQRGLEDEALALVINVEIEFDRYIDQFLWRRPTWSFIGGASLLHHSVECGVQYPLNLQDEYVGRSVAGQVCFRVDPADIDHRDSRLVLELEGTRTLISLGP